MRGRGRYPAPSCSRIRRVTSPPSARPLVSRITAPTIAPIALALPARICSAAAGSASIARRDDRLELARVRDLRQALALDDRRRVAAASVDERAPAPRAPRVGDLLVGRPCATSSASVGLARAVSLVARPGAEPRPARPSPSWRRRAARSARRPRRAARSKYSPSSASNASCAGGLVREAELALVALAALRRAAPAAPRGPRAASPRSAPAAPGRARGSSGSRAPPPSSAAGSAMPLARVEVERLLRHLPPPRPARAGARARPRSRARGSGSCSCS